MMKNFEKCRAEFEIDIENIKQDLCGQIADKISLISNNELFALEKTFAQYRISVNIDSKRIALIEKELCSIKQFLAINS